MSCEKSCLRKREEVASHGGRRIHCVIREIRGGGEGWEGSELKGSMRVDLKAPKRASKG